MPSRKEAREQALKILFQVDVGGLSVDEAMEVWKEAEGREPEEFSTRLVKGVYERTAELDTIIAEASRSWPLQRMAAIDRNILRIALYEILYCNDIPIPVAINEAVELAKKYSTEKSSRFVNGILGDIVRDEEGLKRWVSESPQGPTRR